MKILKIFTTLFFLLTLFISPVSRIMAEETENTPIQIEEEKNNTEESEKENNLQEILLKEQKPKYSWSTILLAILIPSIFVILIYLIFKFFKF